MAYAKKVYPRRRRSSRYRRRYRRRRYRRYNYRRRYRRARRNRPEYKRKEIRLVTNFKVLTEPVDGANMCLVTPSTYEFICIGCENVDRFPPKCVPIRQGTGIDQRIGAKIRPTALRFFGTVTIETKDQSDAAATLGLSAANNLNACMLRMIVFQVRNGDTEKNPLSNEFSPVNPSVITEITVPDYGPAPVRFYNGQGATFYCDPVWFNKFFAIHHDFRTVYRPVENPLGVNAYDGYNTGDRYKSGIYAKSPYRAGIGSSVRILKDKLYNLNPTTAPTFGYRFKTKRPYRMVWKESSTRDNELTENCKNPIYIVWIPIYPVGINIDRIVINQNIQMYYTDL